jgi:L-threonylcarbamoyladenylate synthase
MQDDLNKAVEVLRSGGTILYPTDTLWGIGCDATNTRAVDKIYKIKFRTPQRSLVILADSYEMIARYVGKVPDVAIDLMESLNEPLTIIYDSARNLARNIIAEDGTIAIRVPKDEFCQQLIATFGKPITSTSANISGDPSPLSFGKINPKIKAEVDYICKSNQTSIHSLKPSTIVRINKDGHIEIVRN